MILCYFLINKKFKFIQKYEEYMSSKNNFEDLFSQWEELNNKVGASFGNFDFDTIKLIRVDQKKVEDEIYSALLKLAPEDLKKILPEDCGEMEIGYEGKEKKFYFVMIDPDQDFDAPDDVPMKLMAITFTIKKEVNIIKDFKTDE